MGEKQTGQKRFEQRPEGDGKIRLVSKDGEDEVVQPRRRASPPMMESLVKAVSCTTRRREAQELEKSNDTKI